MERKEREKKIERDVQKGARAVFSIILKALATVVNVILTLLLILVVAGVIVVCAFAIYLSDNVDTDVDELITLSSDQDSITSLYYYNEEGELVEDESQRLSSGTNRLWVSYYDIPDNLVNAFVAIEDKRFWDHNGVDWITTIKATIKYFIPVGSNPGGSTITQQLVKNLTGNDDYSIQRKVTEIFSAMSLEEVKSKNEIMEMYLNTIYLSQGANGVQAAANVYFSKDVSELTLVECAAIAGITQYPTKWDPVQNPENNKHRRNIILAEMLNNGMITQSEYDEAYNAELELNLNYESISLGTTSWYTDAVINEAVDLLMEKYSCSEEIAKQMLYSGGYKIITAMDPEVQAILQKYYEDVSSTSILPVSDVIMPESSMIIADPQTGNILGLVGGRGEKTESRIWNRATMSKRQAGSSIKPVAVYAQALEYGIINASSIVDDTPFNFGETYRADGSVSYTFPSGWPVNANGRYSGRATVDYALTASLNTVSVKLLNKIGVERSFNFLKEKLRFTSLIDSIATDTGVHSDKNLSALALGGMTYGVTLQEMVAAYTMFPNNGVFTELRTVVQILDSDGNVVVDNKVDKEVVISEETAQTMNTFLSHVVKNKNGTAYTALANIREYDLDVAGKTGTTDSNNDRWFIGYTPYYVCGVWVGFDEPQSLKGFITSNQHCQVWGAVMIDMHRELLERAEKGEITLKTFDDDRLIKATYCKDSGKLITSTCNKDPRGSRAETGYFTKDTLPTEACDAHVLVRYCTLGKGVANSACPDEHCTYVALINIRRSFNRDIYITDAEYTWVKLPSNVAPYVSTKLPFYYRLYKGEYPGRTRVSSSNNDYHYNRACPQHK